jgi:hypothetical protein
MVPLLPDRFHFQTGTYSVKRRVSLALDDEGRLAVKDVSGRVVVLTKAGEPLYASISQYGLDLGHLGFPAAAHGTGMWVDHPDQYATFTGNDSRPTLSRVSRPRRGCPFASWAGR